MQHIHAHVAHNINDMLWSQCIKLHLMEDTKAENNPSFVLQVAEVKRHMHPGMPFLVQPGLRRPADRKPFSVAPS